MGLYAIIAVQSHRLCVKERYPELWSVWVPLLPFSVPLVDRNVIPCLEIPQNNCALIPEDYAEVIVIVRAWVDSVLHHQFPGSFVGSFKFRHLSPSFHIGL